MGLVHLRAPVFMLGLDSICLEGGGEGGGARGVLAEKSAKCTKKL